jgi:subtilisin family serine protease
MRRVIVAIVWVCGTAVLLASPPVAGQHGPRFERETVKGRQAVAREVLVKFRQPPPASQIAKIRSEDDAEDMRAIGRAGAYRLRSKSKSATALVASLSHRPDVAYVEPNFVVRIDSEPNDPRFPELWALKNISQVIGGFAGVTGTDIHAESAWNISLGSNSNVVAVIDTGIDYTHPDLAPNMWSAPTAFTVTVGGTPITCAAGTHGFNAINRTCNPMDDQNHGTHVAGTIGAVGDNGTGVVGVNWTTSLMAIKFIDANGSGTTADAIAAVEFAIAVKQRFAGTNGANIRVLSNSWGGPDFSQALLDEVNLANDQNMLFVAGAGNDGFDNDILPFYPASFDAPNVVAVAATDNADDLAWFSNFGASSVHLGAPGVHILSTTIGNHYAYLSGTSMATPHVSGAAALVLSQCAIDTAALKETILGTVDPVPVLGTLTTSGGRLNVHSALSACMAPTETPTGLTARGLDTKVMLSWSAAPGATRYNVKRRLIPGGPYSSIDAAVHGTSYTDTGVVNGTTYYYVVAAENPLGESGNSNEASATPNVTPDLVVSSFVSPAAARSDTMVTLSLTFKNQGLGTAAPSTTRFYFSDNPILDASDVLLNARPAPQLVSGALGTGSVSVTIPPATTGQHYLIAKADAEDVLSENNETNNVAARSIQIGPDLLIAALTLPGNAAADSTIVANDTTKITPAATTTNAGGGTAAASVTRVLLSANTTLDVNDTSLPGTRSLLELAPSLGNSRTTQVMLPGVVAWTYYPIAKADADHVVIESKETNNTLMRSITIGGDLLVTALTVPAESGAGVQITVSDSTANQGGGPVGPTMTKFYLSSNNVFDSSDTLIGSRALSALGGRAANSGSTIVAIPVGLTAGVYYIIAKADADGVAQERQETNNTAVRPVRIGSDLAVSAITAPVKAGAGTAITVIDTTTNSGGGTATESLTRFYLSENNTLDASDTRLTGGHLVPALEPGVTDSGSTSLMLPNVAAGTYYLIAKADDDNVVPESQETNNMLIRSITIGSDLVVSTITAPAKAAAGTAIVVGDTTTNQGGGDAPASVTGFYLVSSSIPGSPEVLLEGSRAVAQLAPGVASTGSASVVIPTETTAGTFYLIAKSDVGGAVNETLETNNTRSRAISIGPDLTISSFVVSASSAVAGAAVTVSDIASNQGAEIAGPSTTRLYLSTDRTIDSSDVVLSPGRSVAQVAVGGSSPGSTSITIPPNTVAGTYYLIVKADADGGVAESVESNNMAVRSIVVTAAAP